MTLDGGLVDQCMAMAAHRYCLGRKNYIVSICQEWLPMVWGMLTPESKGVMIRDTVEYILDNSSRGDTYVESWVELGKWMVEHTDKDLVEWARSSVEWKRSPWPL